MVLQWVEQRGKEERVLGRSWNGLLPIPSVGSRHNFGVATGRAQVLARLHTAGRDTVWPTLRGQAAARATTLCVCAT